jgi:hypothetical protein
LVTAKNSYVVVERYRVEHLVQERFLAAVAGVAMGGQRAAGVEEDQHDEVRSSGN